MTGACQLHIKSQAYDWRKDCLDPEERHSDNYCNLGPEHWYDCEQGRKQYIAYMPDVF